MFPLRFLIIFVLCISLCYACQFKSLCIQCVASDCLWIVTRDGNGLGQCISKENYIPRETRQTFGSLFMCGKYTKMEERILKSNIRGEAPHTHNPDPTQPLHSHGLKNYLQPIPTLTPATIILSKKNISHSLSQSKSNLTSTDSTKTPFTITSELNDRNARRLVNITKFLPVVDFSGSSATVTRASLNANRTTSKPLFNLTEVTILMNSQAGRNISLLSVDRFAESYVPSNTSEFSAHNRTLSVTSSTIPALSADSSTDRPLIILNIVQHEKNIPTEVKNSVDHKTMQAFNNSSHTLTHTPSNKSAVTSLKGKDGHDELAITENSPSSNLSLEKGSLVVKVEVNLFNSFAAREVDTDQHTHVPQLPVISTSHRSLAPVAFSCVGYAKGLESRWMYAVCKAVELTTRLAYKTGDDRLIRWTTEFPDPTILTQCPIIMYRARHC